MVRGRFVVRDGALVGKEAQANTWRGTSRRWQAAGQWAMSYGTDFRTVA